MLSFRVTITSRQNPLVARFREAARGGAGSLLLLDGAHLVADALASGVTLSIAAITPAALERTEVSPLVASLSRDGVEVATVSAVVMGAISPVRTPSGIVALAERPSPAGDRIYAGGVLVVLPWTCRIPAMSVRSFASPRPAAPPGSLPRPGPPIRSAGRRLRGSMGSALRLPIAHVTDADSSVANARRRGFRIVATVPRGGRTPDDSDLSGAVALLIGGEGRGLSEALIDGADERVTIPMAAPVESLNAAVTAALLIYEARRQNFKVRS